MQMGKTTWLVFRYPVGTCGIYLCAQRSHEHFIDAIAVADCMYRVAAYHNSNTLRNKSEKNPFRHVTFSEIAYLISEGRPVAHINNIVKLLKLYNYGPYF